MQFLEIPVYSGHSTPQFPLLSFYLLEKSFKMFYLGFGPLVQSIDLYKISLKYPDTVPLILYLKDLRGKIRGGYIYWQAREIDGEEKFPPAPNTLLSSERKGYFY